MLTFVLLLLVVPGITSKGVPFKHNETRFSILVTNSVTHSPNKTYETSVPHKGILLGGMWRLQANNDFKFTYRNYADYGPFLASVNGLRGSSTAYWELLVKEKDGKIIKPDAGIGCYLPNEDETIILKYTTTPSVTAAAGSK